MLLSGIAQKKSKVIKLPREAEYKQAGYFVRAKNIIYNESFQINSSDLITLVVR